ncbi:hypothetical protein [Kordia sp.]|uniref:hypothetical protein n=1 Tax=Kordia sp. TaxID=1965332 RepID=UPI0025BC2FDB|nr:hypothetical protein [Kordia sp.]MCH2193984.1 hypothetical protein [Kordia sp.]
MRKLLILFLIGSLLSCTTNTKLETVEVHFYPSFLHPTKFTIDLEKKTLEQYTYQDHYNVEEKTEDDTYVIHQKDTLIVHYQKTFPIDDEVLQHFLRSIESNEFNETIENYKPVLDGIGFGFKKINTKNDSISLSSNITNRREATIEYKLLEPFFELAYTSIDDYEGISGVENIQDYFAYGLRIKKAADNPLEYRIWGSIRGCREDQQELLTFLENLPDNEPVLFDLRNGSFSYCLDEVLEEFVQKKTLYIYGNKYATKAKK